MSDVIPPAIPGDHPDRHIWCQFALHAAFLQIAARAVAAGWNEREVAAALVDLADNHMLCLITIGEVEAIVEAIRKQS
jgi:hypothetical protein